MKKTISCLLSFAATVYTIWYMHFGVPYKNSGALSKIGLSHHILFAVWGVLTFGALCFAITLAYQKTLKTKIYIPLNVISGIGMLLTITNDFDFDKKLEYYLHCTGSLTFSAVTGVTIFLLFLLNYKKNTVFKIFTYLSAGILIADLICLLIFKETGLIEALPIFAGYLLLGITVTRREKVELAR